MQNDYDIMVARMLCSDIKIGYVPLLKQGLNFVHTLSFIAYIVITVSTIMFYNLENQTNKSPGQKAISKYKKALKETEKRMLHRKKQSLTKQG